MTYKTNIPTKEPGDKLSSSEFNQLNNNFNMLVDSFIELSNTAVTDSDVNIKRLKNDLVWSPMTGTSGITSVGYDGKMYGLDFTSVFSISDPTLADPYERHILYATLMTNLPSIPRYFKVHSDYVIYFGDYDSGNGIYRGYVAVAPDVDTAPVLKLTTGDGVNSKRLHQLNCFSYDDGLINVHLAGEYGRDFEETGLSSLFLSKDKGETWEEVRQSKSDKADASSHFHHSAYDQYIGRIFTSYGDDSNRGVSYSDDFGVTWTEHRGVYQPTLIFAIQGMTVLGRDTGTGASLVGLNHKDYIDYKGNDLELYMNDLGNVEHLYNSERYPDLLCLAQKGQEAYVYFPTRDDKFKRGDIIATGDSGKSWHNIAGLSSVDSYFGSISGIDSNGYLYGVVSVSSSYAAGTVLYTKPEWI